jgi:predicted ATP-grasp superfamily ATP-dependent carboligase
MEEETRLNDPWLVAVWPGMGNVGVGAGVYLMAKLGMHEVAEFAPRRLFDMDHVDVINGIIHPGRVPRSRFFTAHEAGRRHDILVFIGEAQPPAGTDAFCRKLVDFAKDLGVKRVFSFAAMATSMRFRDRARVFGAASDQAGLKELERLDLTILKEGQISGLNGVLPGVAAEAGLRSVCLLGEMPQLFPQFPYPKGSQAVLEVFAEIAGIDLDLSGLEKQSAAMEKQLTDLIEDVERAMNEAPGEGAEFGAQLELPPEPRLDKPKPGLKPKERKRIEQLFEQARHDRSRAYELKHELDRLQVFKQYEDRFLDLFKEPG